MLAVALAQAVQGERWAGAVAQQPLAPGAVFGPVAAIVGADGYEHALALANDTEQGLSSGIVTGDPRIIRHFVAHAEAGMIQVNLPTAGMDFHAPFTGRKQAGYGPAEKGTYAREFFTSVKVVHQREPSL